MKLPDVAGWVKTHRKQAIAGGAVIGVGLVATKRKPKANASNPSAATNAYDSTSTDLINHVQPQIDVFGDELYRQGQTLDRLLNNQRTAVVVTPPKPAAKPAALPTKAKPAPVPTATTLVLPGSGRGGGGAIGRIRR